MNDPISLIRNFLLSDKELMESAMETVELSDGQVLFHRGDIGDAFYLIQTGQIRIFTLDQEGKEITLNTLSAGETLGELALVDAQPRSASASSVGCSSLLRLNRDDFLRRIHNSPILTNCIIQLLSGRARHMTEYIERLGHWARMIIDGQYNQVIKAIEEVDPKGDRALAAVAGSIGQMVKAVQEREENLRKEVVQLRIEIDEEKRKRQVDEIVNNEAFDKMLQLAKQRRKSNPT
ncbi:Crp/Fnr family transcriptional regulator [Kamptonema formosum]|uniref:Crp/Fnr family transcriptional regulator n=1 Tax=Kamptonema formosum TaxID=331992 RepID=UPI000380A7E0|nr:cyclic nucleotide-binding domain-containing protein [Oscillatoria sp. PCC 10802]